MRCFALALALGAALSFPIASFADGDAEDASGAESGEAEASDAPAPAGAQPASAAQRVPRRPDLGGRQVEAAQAATGSEESEASEETEESEEEEEPGFWGEYFESARTRILTGLNGIATAPADPVMATVETPKALEEAGYVRRPLGFASGLLLMFYRTFSGTVDVGFSPIPWLPVVSPVPRYKLIPGFTHDDE